MLSFHRSVKKDEASFQPTFRSLRREKREWTRGGTKQTKDLRLKARAKAEMEEIDALKTVKNPTHGGAVRGLVHLAGNSVRRLRELAAPYVFRQAIDQQANHDATQRHHAFRLFDKHAGSQEEGICEKATSPFHSSLLFLRQQDALMRKRLLIQNVRGDEKAGLFAGQGLTFRRVNGQRGEELPDCLSRRSILFRASFLLGMSLLWSGKRRCQNGGFPFSCLRPCLLRILLTGEPLVRYMPEAFLPRFLGFLHLLLSLLFGRSLSGFRTHDDPAFLSLRPIHRAYHPCS